MRFQLIGLRGSRSLECRNCERTSSTRPKRPLGDPAGDRLAARDRTAAPTSSGRAARAGARSRALIASFAARSMPNGFSPSRCLPASSDGDVDLLVQVVRHGAVDDFDVVVGEQLAVVGRRAAAPGRAARTSASTSGLASQTRDELAAGRRCRRGASSARRRSRTRGPSARRRFRAPTPDDAASSAVARSPSAAASSPRDRGCWMTLRP